MADSTFFAANQPVHKKAAEEIYLFSFQGTDPIENGFLFGVQKFFVFLRIGGDFTFLRQKIFINATFCSIKLNVHIFNIMVISGRLFLCKYFQQWNDACLTFYPFYGRPSSTFKFSQKGGQNHHQLILV
jgi:hypothetical protein